MAVNPNDLIKEWWNTYQADPRADYDKIISGMRQQLETSGQIKFSGGKTQSVSNSQLQTGACQYWIRGLSAVCSHWDHLTMSCTFENEAGDIPSGYGLGSCDRLGRRDWCNKYEPSVDTNLNEFVCVAPCIERTGLGKQILSDFGVSYRPLDPSEIQGYNADENGVGRCDGWGMGRGDQGPYSNVESVYVDLPICRFYRPQQMGFGAIQPRPFHGSDTPGRFKEGVNWVPDTLADLYDGSKADPTVAMDIRLPFAFQVYNSRSMYQKCAHWNNKTPSYFEVDYIGTDPSDFQIIMSDESYCECDAASLCDPYRNIVETWAPNVPWILQDVWAPYGGIVCNGAKPECPCYTGKWIYCIDNNMRDGMRISADQIFELRFWAANWSSQSEYEEFYLYKPGPTQEGYADESTADIYTFTKWNKFNALDPNESQMAGYRHSMCMPAPLHMREFDPSIYVTKDPVVYPRINEYTGTNIREEGVLFPTLVRELENPYYYVPDILIIYPYYTANPWEIVECNQEDLVDFCTHDYNLMSTPYIAVVGHTTIDSPMYVFNPNLSEINNRNAGTALFYMDRYNLATQIPELLRQNCNEAIEAFLEECAEEGTALTTGSTDSYGFFNIPRVELKLNELNTLYVICKYSEEGGFPLYIFRKVKVLTRYWGALITQTSMQHEHEGNIHYNPFPQYYSPRVLLTGGVQTTNGTVQTVFSTYSLYQYGLFEDGAYYSYCLNLYEETDEDVEKWTQIGSSGYIWAEIDNIDISYLWGFEIVEAYLTLRDNDDRSNISLCNYTGLDEIRIPLSPAFPFNGEDLEIDRRAIPPNAVVLQAPQPLPFFNNDWQLYIEYKYTRLEPFKLNPTWPLELDQVLSPNHFVSSPYTVVHETGDTNFTVSTGALTSRGTAKIMAYIADDSGRIQTAAATKMLLMGINLSCRSIEISYKYIANALFYDLQPASGFFTWRGSPKVNQEASRGKRHAKAAKCGDHECNPGNCIGPMWYPFNNCTDVDFYATNDIAGVCTMNITEGNDAIGVMGNGAWRYGVAEEYKAFVSLGANSLSPCATGFYYHFSHAPMSNMLFNGYANKKGKVDVATYAEYGWSLPPLGNYGREFTERVLVRDFASYVDFSTADPTTKLEYMPMVFDKEDLRTDLNCFADVEDPSELDEPFSCSSMLSNYTASFIEEQISEDRYRFEDIIDIQYHARCMYPQPLLIAGTDYTIRRYGFKNENHVWAWPEYWLPIERNVESDFGQFRFMEIIRPDYYFDRDKKEHRFITDEGECEIIFEPPVPASSEEGDTNNSSYPSISINGIYPRFFKISYDNYDETNVEWMDESITGEENSSGGEEEGSIYEVANNGSNIQGEDGATIRWMHDFDTLFDENASKDTDENRKVAVGVDLDGNIIYEYFNRGLEIYIPRNRLQFLPMALSFAGSPQGLIDNNEEYIGYWPLDTYGIAPISVVVKGNWGAFGEVEEALYSRPAIKVAESEDEPVFTDGEVPDWPSNEVGYLPYRQSIYANGDFKSFEIELRLSRMPERFTKTLKYFMVKVYPFVSEQIQINSVEVTLGQYTRATERIKVWEKKYYVGEANLPYANADGPNTAAYRTADADYKNRGQNLPAANAGLPEGKAISKLCMLGMGAHHSTDESISVSMSNLKEVEKLEQENLYREMYELDEYDEITFNGLRHPAIHTWLQQINDTIDTPADLNMKYEKVEWSKHELNKSLNQEGEFFQPGGHYFDWSNSAFRTRCYIFGPIQTVYSVDYIHHNHGGRAATYDATEAYAGWGRLEFYEGIFWQMKSTGQEADYKSTDLLSGAKDNVTNRSR